MKCPKLKIFIRDLLYSSSTLIRFSFMDPQLERSKLQAALATESILGEVRQGIDRAFDVIRNHTVHTKGYVITAFKFIDEFGTGEDKALLNELIQSKTELAAAGTADTPRKPIQKKKK